MNKDLKATIIETWEQITHKKYVKTATIGFVKAYVYLSKTTTMEINDTQSNLGLVILAIAGVTLIYFIALKTVLKVNKRIELQEEQNKLLQELIDKQ